MANAEHLAKLGEGRETRTRHIGDFTTDYTAALTRLIKDLKRSR